MVNLLPKNEPKPKQNQPKCFYIWGTNLAGKTYLASQFPSPLILNTDGNDAHIDTPSIKIDTFEKLVQAVREFEDGKHDFKTLVIDLSDDVVVLLQNHICQKYKVEDEGDVGYGKAFREDKAKWRNLMLRITNLPYYIVFTGYETEKQEDGIVTPIPSLKGDYYSWCLGRCDMSIRCRKVGNKFVRQCVGKREEYREEDIKDKELLEVLKTIPGAITKERGDDNVR